MKHFYKMVLFCWSTVVCIGANCGRPNFNIHTQNDGQQQTTKDKILRKKLKAETEDKIFRERLETVLESKIQVPSSEQVIQEIASTIPQCAQAEELVALKRAMAWLIQTIGWPMPKWLQAEAWAKPERQLLEKFVHQNVDFFRQQYSIFMEQFKQLLLEFPSVHLQFLVPKLEEAENKDKVIKAFLQTAPDLGRIETFIKFKFRLAEKIWECFAEWIRKPEISEECSKEILQEIQEDFPTKMSKEDREWVQRLILKQTLEEVQKGMVAELLRGIPKKNA